MAGSRWHFSFGHSVPRWPCGVTMGFDSLFCDEIDLFNFSYRLYFLFCHTNNHLPGRLATTRGIADHPAPSPTPAPCHHIDVVKDSGCPNPAVSCTNLMTFVPPLWHEHDAILTFNSPPSSGLRISSRGF